VACAGLPHDRRWGAAAAIAAAPHGRPAYGFGAELLGARIAAFRRRGPPRVTRRRRALLQRPAPRAPAAGTATPAYAVGAELLDARGLPRNGRGGAAARTDSGDVRQPRGVLPRCCGLLPSVPPLGHLFTAIPVVDSPRAHKETFARRRASRSPSARPRSAYAPRSSTRRSRSSWTVCARRARAAADPQAAALGAFGGRP
jgi:hypothetical protein